MSEGRLYVVFGTGQVGSALAADVIGRLPRLWAYQRRLSWLRPCGRPGVPVPADEPRNPSLRTHWQGQNRSTLPAPKECAMLAQAEPGADAADGVVATLGRPDGPALTVRTARFFFFFFFF